MRNPGSRMRMPRSDAGTGQGRLPSIESVDGGEAADRSHPRAPPSAGAHEQLVERQQYLHHNQKDDIPFDAQRVFGLQQLQLGFHRT
jgi:hypothetical protein